MDREWAEVNTNRIRIMKTDTNTEAGRDCPAAICSVIDSPEAEFRHLKEMAKANGFDSITDAVTKAKRYAATLQAIRGREHSNETYRLASEGLGLVP